jgi:hypothetical protein
VAIMDAQVMHRSKSMEVALLTMWSDWSRWFAVAAEAR